MHDIVKKLLSYEKGTLLKITWDNGYTSIYELDTFYDTDNGLELEDTNYREFHVALVREVEKVGYFVELGDYEHTPSSIEVITTNEIIWSKSNI